MRDDIKVLGKVFVCCTTIAVGGGASARGSTLVDAQSLAGVSTVHPSRICSMDVIRMCH